MRNSTLAKVQTLNELDKQRTGNGQTRDRVLLTIDFEKFNKKYVREQNIFNKSIFKNIYESLTRRV